MFEVVFVFLKFFIKWWVNNVLWVKLRLIIVKGNLELNIIWVVFGL